MFYHDIKEHLSPSAMEQWKRSRSSFINTYFEDKKIDLKTAAIKGGKAIHGLIEGGMIEVKKSFKINEEPIKVDVPGTKYGFMGIPDSREGNKFVDYKSGKANNWKDKIHSNIKVMATAWLVWMESDQPDEVKGYVEFIETTYDEITKEVVPVEDKSNDVIEIVYTKKQMEDFTKLIKKTMDEINEFYETWKERTDAFISDKDVEEYEKLDAKKKVIEEEQKEIKKRIQDQMTIGGLPNYKTDTGTFYITTRETYDYPENLKVQIGKKKYTLKEVEEIEEKKKAVLSSYKITNEPTKVSESIGYRSK